jgi:hypothetical protein
MGRRFFMISYDYSTQSAHIMTIMSKGLRWRKSAFHKYIFLLILQHKIDYLQMQILYIILFIFLLSCGQTSTNNDLKESTDTTSASLTVKFLWRDSATIVINQDFCKTITNPEKAALGYVATFIGNECWWDGDPSDKRNNLKCEILSALNLGYQCSDQHLGFLRQWFNQDSVVMKQLENCPTTPNTSTIQDTFDEINLIAKGNEIIISFKASGVNLREMDSWSWTETNYFQVDQNRIRLIKKERSKVEHEKLDVPD